MTLATTCPQCKTSFKVVPDQLKLRRGLVRCGKCQHVFSGIDFLSYVEPPAADPPSPSASTDPRTTARALDGTFASPDTHGFTAQLPVPPAVAPATEAQRGASLPADELNTAFFLPEPEPDARAVDPYGVDPSYVPPDETPIDIPMPGGRHPMGKGEAAQGSPDGGQDSGADSQAGVASADTLPATSERPKTSADDTDALPSWAKAPADHEPPARHRAHTPPLEWALAGVLALMLAAQAVIGWRDPIAARITALAEPLRVALSPLGLDVGPPRERGALTIESFELHAAAAPRQLELSAVIRNDADHVVALPAIELTLTDASGALLVRKVIPAEIHAGTGSTMSLPPRSERPIRLMLAHDGLQAAGYSADIFYP